MMQEVRPTFEAPTENPVIDQPARKREGRVWILATVVISLAVIMFAVFRASGARGSFAVPELPPPGSAAVADTTSPAGLSHSFREIAKSIKPAVVYISIVERVGENSRFPGFFGPDIPQEPGQPRRRPGAGSGFIVTDDGFILTNNHVVGSADSIDVTLGDGRQFKGRLIGTDPETDLAVVKIEAGGLPIAVLGNSDEVQQGDWVLALGSPYGLQQTLTAGIVSATGRELPGQLQQYSRYIQTDASINPGNSGGPLVNMQGEVIGINTMIFSPSGGNIGIGFSLASNVVRNIFGDLVKNGRITRGYLGVNIVPLDAARARAFGLEPNSGAFVQGLPDTDSPARRAGLKPGDIITAFDGRPVKAPRELTDAVAATPVGKSVKVDFLRDGQPMSVTVEVAERPGRQAASAAPPEQGNNETQTTRLGIVAQTITPEAAERMKLLIKSGAVVTEVQPGSPAQEAGLRHGDVIHRIDRTEVKSVEDLVNAARSLQSGDQVLLQIERGGEMNFITITID